MYRLLFLYLISIFCNLSKKFHFLKCSSTFSTSLEKLRHKKCYCLVICLLHFLASSYHKKITSRLLTPPGWDMLHSVGWVELVDTRHWVLSFLFGNNFVKTVILFTGPLLTMSLFPGHIQSRKITSFEIVSYLFGGDMFPWKSHPCSHTFDLYDESIPPRTSLSEINVFF